MSKLGEAALGIGTGAANTAVGQAMGLVFGGIQDRRQREQAKKLGEIQGEQNRRQADYSQQLAMQMRDSSIASQTKQMREEGLNIGLMYGGSGAGGATAAGAGQAGAVSGQSAGDPNAGIGMGMQLAAQMALMKAQKENIEADTANKKAGTENTTEDTGIKKVTGQVARNTVDAQISKIESEAQQALSEASIKVKENVISNETYEDRIKQIKLEAIGEALENELKKAGIQKSYTEIKKILNDIKIADTGIEYQGTDKIAGKYIEVIYKGLRGMLSEQ